MLVPVIDVKLLHSSDTNELGSISCTAHDAFFILKYLMSSSRSPVLVHDPRVQKGSCEVHIAAAPFSKHEEIQKDIGEIISLCGVNATVHVSKKSIEDQTS